MKICFDVNAVVHLFARSDSMADVVFAYDIANMRRFDVFVPACSLADIAYILHRRGLTAGQVDEALEAMFKMFDVIDVNGSDGLKAHRSEIKVFEDALIAQSCDRNGIDLILTYNVKDFRTSSVAAMSPPDFVRMYKPARYAYAEVELRGT